MRERRTFGMLRSRLGVWSALLLILMVVGSCVRAPQARADGDPGSDVLVNQSFFAPADADMSIAQQTALGDLLQSAQSHGFPLRVAIIAGRDDLGSITYLWDQPESYAHFLGIELSDAYPGRLLVVMPDGFGFSWPGHAGTERAAERQLADIRVYRGESFVAATTAAVERLAASSHVRLTGGRSAAEPSTTASGSGATSATSRGASLATMEGGPIVLDHSGSAHVLRITVLVLIVMSIVLLAAGLILGRGGWRPRRSRNTRARPAVSRGWPARLTAGSACALVLLIVAAALLDDLSHSAESTASTLASRGGTIGDLATNPNLDPGQSLPGHPAPNFTLYDQFGHKMTLSQYRGKVVLLAFDDDECTTVCPLTTTAMLDAKRLLGRAGSQVELLGVNADEKETQIEDVQSYSELHGMLHSWRFGTGSLTTLQHVWADYGVEADIVDGLISHTPALYVIDRLGRERMVYLTTQSYSAVGQFGQLIAQEVSRLLPGHPHVASRLAYGAVRTVGPDVPAELPGVAGHRVRIGAGHARLYVFFDTWDREVMPIGGQLDALNEYARVAKSKGLPQLVGIDEGSVEPSPEALPAFLRTLAHPLAYPVGIDSTGRVADGYQVQGQPWLVLASAGGQIIWYDEPDTSQWPTESQLLAEVRAALRGDGGAPATPAEIQHDLAHSPAPLAALHHQSSQLLGGDETALAARIRSLRGYPIVLNLWASWCTACQAEFNLFSTASAQYGRRAAFLGADIKDSAADAAAFLHAHSVSYPSYQASLGSIDKILPGGIDGLPMTIYITPSGKVLTTHIGTYASQGSLDLDIQTYALR